MGQTHTEQIYVDKAMAARADFVNGDAAGTSGLTQSDSGYFEPEHLSVSKAPPRVAKTVAVVPVPAPITIPAVEPVSISLGLNRTLRLASPGPELDLLALFPRVFMEFNFKAGALAEGIDAAVGFLTWREPNVTLLGGVAAFWLCFRPQLLLLLPYFIILSTVHRNWVRKQHGDGPPNPYPPPVPYPELARPAIQARMRSSMASGVLGVPKMVGPGVLDPTIEDISREEMERNLRFIQNFMLFHVTSDSAMRRAARWLDWSEPEKTMMVVYGTLAALFATLVVVPMIPAAAVQWGVALSVLLFLAAAHPSGDELLSALATTAVRVANPIVSLTPKIPSRKLLTIETAIPDIAPAAEHLHERLVATGQLTQISKGVTVAVAGNEAGFFGGINACLVTGVLTDLAVFASLLMMA